MCQSRRHAFLQTETDTFALHVWWCVKERYLSLNISFDYYRIIIIDCAGSSRQQVAFASVLERKMSHKQLKQKKH